jgi:FkbM family methyltransferase
VLSAAKQLSISLGLYKPARAVHRAFSPTERNEFNANKRMLSQFVNAGDLAFDVGANIGNRSEIMLSLGATVVAFEPQPKCAREARARGNRRLTVIESAVGSKVGTAELHLKSANVLASLVPDWQGNGWPDTGSLNVPVTTLDVEIGKFGKPVFCKIDVEGYETEVLRGLSSPIKSLSFEYHCSDDGITKIRECLRILSKIANYEVNLIGEEKSDWLLTTWLPAGQFAASFPTCAAAHFWGDVYVRQII